MIKLKKFLNEFINYNDVSTDNHDGFVSVRKKPILVKALQISEPFEIQSKEGLVKGKKNDWLMIGIEGEKYICDNEIFKKTYDIVEY